MSPLAPCVYLIYIHNGDMKPLQNTKFKSVNDFFKLYKLNYSLRSSLLFVVVYLFCNFSSPDPSTKTKGVNEVQGSEGQGSRAC